MFSTPETFVYVLDKNREISPLEREREECYGGKDLEKRWVLRREWKTLWEETMVCRSYRSCRIFLTRSALSRLSRASRSLRSFTSSVTRSLSWSYCSTTVSTSHWKPLTRRLSVGWPAEVTDTHPTYTATAGLWPRHCRQMPRAYDVEGAYERWLQNILNISGAANKVSLIS